MAPEGREFDPIDHLSVAAARLSELAGDPTNLHHRDPGVVGQDDRHLEDDPQPVAYRIGRGVERLGAVASLEQEGFAAGDRG